jgi:hypothetical protein
MPTYCSPEPCSFARRRSNPDLAMDLLFGPLMWRLVTGRRPLSEDEVDTVVDSFLMDFERVLSRARLEPDHPLWETAHQAVLSSLGERPRRSDRDCDSDYSPTKPLRPPSLSWRRLHRSWWPLLSPLRRPGSW